MHQRCTMDTPRIHQGYTQDAPKMHLCRARSRRELEDQTVDRKSNLLLHALGLRAKWILGRFGMFSPRNVKNQTRHSFETCVGRYVVAFSLYPMSFWWLVESPACFRRCFLFGWISSPFRCGFLITRYHHSIFLFITSWDTPPWERAPAQTMHAWSG